MPACYATLLMILLVLIIGGGGDEDDDHDNGINYDYTKIIIIAMFMYWRQ